MVAPPSRRLESKSGRIPRIVPHLAQMAYQGNQRFKSRCLATQLHPGVSSVQDSRRYHTQVNPPPTTSGRLCQARLLKPNRSRRFARRSPAPRGTSAHRPKRPRRTVAPQKQCRGPGGTSAIGAPHAGHSQRITVTASPTHAADPPPATRKSRCDGVPPGPSRRNPTRESSHTRCANIERTGAPTGDAPSNLGR